MTDELRVTDLALSSPVDSAEPHASEVWSLNRPESRNALNPSLVGALRDALRAAERKETQVVVITGSGLSFCAGADLRFLQTHDATKGETPRQLLESIWDLTIEMEESPIAFVAALHGHAVAGGLELALACDVVIAAADARIGDGHVANNLLPGGGASARLERALGRGPSAWLALTGELLPATDQAFALWLKHVVPVEDLPATYRSVADSLIRSSPQARARFKNLLHRNYPAPSVVDRDTELDTFEKHWVDQNLSEALRLYLDRNRKAS
jgi:enoyl-CoA hydratase